MLDGDARLREPARVGVALVAERVVARGEDERRGQIREVGRAERRGRRLRGGARGGGVRGSSSGGSKGGGAGEGVLALTTQADEAHQVDDPVLIGAQDEVVGASGTDAARDLRSLRRLRSTFEGVILAGSRNVEPDGALPPADVPVSQAGRSCRMAC